MRRRDLTVGVGPVPRQEDDHVVADGVGHRRRERAAVGAREAAVVLLHRVAGLPHAGVAGQEARAVRRGTQRAGRWLRRGGGRPDLLLSAAPAAAPAAHGPAPVVLGFLQDQHPLAAAGPGRRDPADQVVEVARSPGQEPQDVRCVRHIAGRRAAQGFGVLAPAPARTAGGLRGGGLVLRHDVLLCRAGPHPRDRLVRLP